MNDELIRNKQNNNFMPNNKSLDGKSFDDNIKPIPKIFANPLRDYIPVNIDKVNIAKNQVAPNQSKPIMPNINRPIKNPTKNQAMQPMQHSLNHYMSNFQAQIPQQQQYNHVANNNQAKQSFWLYFCVALIGLLLFSNLFFMLKPNSGFNLPQSSRNNLTTNDDASLEFETIIPLTASPSNDEETIYEAGDNSANPISNVNSHTVNVPKRRVLVISEDARKELLQQLQAPAQQPDNLEHIYEYYRK